MAHRRVARPRKALHYLLLFFGGTLACSRVVQLGHAEMFAREQTFVTNGHLTLALPNYFTYRLDYISTASLCGGLLVNMDSCRLPGFFLHSVH